LIAERLLIATSKARHKKESRDASMLEIPSFKNVRWNLIYD